MNFINEDLDFSSYWHHFCKSTFKNTYFSSVNRTLHEKEMHGLNVNFDESSKYINHILNLWNEDCYLFKTMQHFCKLSLYPFFKDRDKKSFKQKDFKIKDFYKNFDKENKENYPQYMLKTYPILFVQSAVLTIDLEFTWLDSKIICLDCDDLQPLFEINQTNIVVSNFLRDTKTKGCVLFSSPTNTPFDRFKILIKISDLNCSYKILKSDFKKSHLSKIFSLENYASLFGDNTLGQSIINPINGLNIFPMTSNDFFYQKVAFQTMK